MLPILKNIITQRKHILYNVSSQELALIDNIAKTYSGYKIIDLQPQDYIEFNSTQNTPILITYPDHPDSIFLLVLNNTNIQIKLVNNTGVKNTQPSLQALRLNSSEIEQIKKNLRLNITDHINDIQIDALQKNNQYISLVLPKLNMNISDNFKSVDASDLPTQDFKENISLLTGLNNTNINLAIKKNKDTAFDSSGIVQKGTIKVFKHFSKEGDTSSLNAAYDCQDEMCQPIQINYGESSFKDDNSPPTHANTIFGIPVSHTSVNMNVNPIDFSTAKFLVKSVAFVGIAAVGTIAILSIDYSVTEEASGKSIHALNNTKQYLDSNIPDYNNTKKYLDSNIPNYNNTKQYLDSNIPDYNNTKKYLDSNIPNYNNTKQYLDSNIPDYNNTFDVQNDAVSIISYCKGFILDNIPLNIYYNYVCVYDKNNRITEIPVHHIEYNIPSEKINDTDILEMYPVYTTLNLKDFVQSWTNKDCIILNDDTKRVLKYNNMIQDLNLDIPIIYENRDNVFQHIIVDLSDSCLGVFGIKSLVNFLSTSQSIMFLDLANNYIGTFGIDSLCDILRNQNVKMLDISHNYLGDQGLKKLRNCLVHNTDLRLLKLSSNKITNEGLSAIDKILRSNDYINVINLASNNINSTDKIVDALKENIALMTLDLSGNTFDSTQSDIIDFYLQQNQFVHDITRGTSSFSNSDKIEMAKVLKGLSSNPLTIINHDDLQEMNIDAIMHAIMDNNYVKELNLSSNVLNDYHVKIIAQILRLNHILKILDISKNNITRESIDLIIEALKENISLTALELSGNTFDSTQSDIIDFYLTQNKFVSRITSGIASISYNEKIEIAKVLKGLSSNPLTIINHDDLQVLNIYNIAKAIMDNNYVKELNLSSNVLNDDHSTIIAHILKFNHILEILDISKNNITGEGIDLIIEALKENISLTALEFSGNTFDSTQSDIIDFYLQQNQFVHDITFNTSSFSNSDKLEIAQVLKGLSSNPLTIINHHDLKEINIYPIMQAIIEKNYVKELNLSSNVLNDDHVKIIFSTLRFNHIVEILDISENNITRKGIDTIIASLKDNISLTALEFSGNTFDSTQSDIIDFYLQQNQFVHDITRGTSSFYSVTKSDMAKVLKGLSSNPLTIINHDDLQEINIYPIMQAIIEKNYVKELNLSSNVLNDDHVKIIAQQLRFNHILEILDISKNNITRKGIDTIIEALKENISLTELEFSGNTFDSTQSNIIDFYLKQNQFVHDITLHTASFSNSDKLEIAQVLKGLSSNPLTIINHHDLKAINIYSIMHAILENNYVKELNLSSNVLNDNYITIIAKALVFNHILEILDISKNNITGEGIDTIIEGLGDNMSLTELELSGNTFNRTQSNIIDFYLKQNQFVHDITRGTASFSNSYKLEIAQVLKGLSSNPLTIINHHDLKAFHIDNIAKAISHNNYVKELNLSSNFFNDTHAKVIAHIFRFNDILEILDISENNITCEGIDTIIASLKDNISLTKLELSGNTFDSTQSDIIAFYLQQNQFVHDITLDTASFDYVDKLAIAKVLKGLSSNPLTIINHHDLQAFHIYNIAKAISHNNYVKELNLSSNVLNDTHAKVIAHILRSNDILKILDISENNITREGIDTIIDPLKDNMSLTKLALSGNTFDSTQSDIIDFYLQQNQWVDGITLEITSFNYVDKLQISRVLKGVISSNTLTIINHHNLQAFHIYNIMYAIMDNNYVKELNLSSNVLNDTHVEIIAQTLGLNHILERLDISKNNITGEGIDTIIEALKDNMFLTKLALSGNTFNRTQSNIIAFYLQQNQFVHDITLDTTSFDYVDKLAIAKVLKGLSSNSLRIIDHPDLKKFNIQAIADALKDNNSITKLVLHSNDINSEDIAIIGDALKHHKTITELDLSINHIGNEGAKNLADALKDNTSIAKLVLSRNNISDQGIVALSNGLKHHKTITELDLSFNSIGDEGTKAIADALKDNNSITMLIISFHGITAQAIVALEKALRINIHLMDLLTNLPDQYDYNIINYYLTQNKFVSRITSGISGISYNDKIEIAQMLKTHSNKLTIRTRGFLGLDNIKAIADILKNNADIIELNLPFNRIDNEGAKIIIDALIGSTYIKKLNLSHNEIDNYGAYIIVKLIKVNNYITELDLSFNNIGDDGAKAVADALKDNTSIARLVLSYNDITEQGIVALSNGLKHNNAITELEVSFNNISNDLLECLHNVSISGDILTLY